MGGPSGPPTVVSAPDAAARDARRRVRTSPTAEDRAALDSGSGRPRLRAYDPAPMSERPQVLEMRHITKRFPGIVANDDVSFDLFEGEVHALLGENGAGKSTLMNILYGLYHADEGEILIKGKPVRLGVAERVDRGRRGDGAPALHAHPGDDGRGEHRPRRGADAERDRVRRPRGRAARQGDLGPLRAGRRPGGEDRGHHRRPAAARRDPEGALPRGGHPRPRRADRRAHAAGGAGALRGDPRPHGARQVGDLHHAQAERGARHRRPDHRPAPRQADRDAAGRRRHGGEPRPPDGGARGAAPGREDLEQRPARRCSRSRACASTTTAASRRSAASRSRCGPARSSAWPASTGTARRS